MFTVIDIFNIEGDWVNKLCRICGHEEAMKKKQSHDRWVCVPTMCGINGISNQET